MLIFALLAVLVAVSGAAQRYRVNRQKLCLEGPSFVQKTPTSNQTSMYIEDFSLTLGESKEVTVYLYSVDPIWSLQVYLNLPEGLTVAGDAALTDAFKQKTNYRSGGTTRNDFTIASGLVNQHLRVIIYNSQKSSSLPAGTGQSVSSSPSSQPGRATVPPGRRSSPPATSSSSPPSSASCA